MKASLSVKARIALTVGILAAVTAAVGALGYHTTDQVNESFRSSYNDDFLVEAWLAEIVSLQHRNFEATLTAFMSRDASVIRMAHARVLANRRRIIDRMAEYDKTVYTQEERALDEEFIQARGRVVESADAVFEALEQADYDRAGRLQRELAAADAGIDSADKLLAFQVRSANESKAAADRNFKSNTFVNGFAIAAGIAAASVLGWLLTRSMLNALKQAVDVAERIARGELGHRIESTAADEFGKLLQALSTMDAKLVEIVGAVRSGSDAVGSASRQLAQSNADLSDRTQRQASALEETASSMEEINATVRQSADNASHANQLAVGARDQAHQGGEVVGCAISAMAEINTASRRIVQIIGVIDELAFQTNLLALNAAVEAARAGDQGRGFAVVASEVRGLALRSASAAREIKGLIQDAVEKVEAGTAFVDRSGKTLEEIVRSITKVTDIVAEISTASHEQAAGIEQVNGAVIQMDQTTQENATLVEQAAAAGKSMEEQAIRLVQQVAFFQITDARSTVPAKTWVHGVSDAPQRVRHEP